MASGYIAGGAIAGIIIAFLNVKEDIRTWLGSWETWATENNPLFAGDYASLWAMIPFIILAIVLYAVGREWLLAARRPPLDGR